MLLHLALFRVKIHIYQATDLSAQSQCQQPFLDYVAKDFLASQGELFIPVSWQLKLKTVEYAA